MQSSLHVAAAGNKCTAEEVPLELKLCAHLPWQPGKEVPSLRNWEKKK
jgi:hypothetical protein